ncbi:MAG: transglutaminase domain-containing protein [Candidatus Hodarchaeales archaeon]|jgi:hypothetical protein
MQFLNKLVTNKSQFLATLILVLPLIISVVPVTASSETRNANGYSGAYAWFNPTAAYTSDGVGSWCQSNAAHIDYSFEDPSLTFESGMFYTCKLKVKWKCTDKGGGGGGGPNGPIGPNNPSNTSESMEITDVIYPLSYQEEQKKGGVQTLGSPYLDILCVKFYHKTSNTWTSWYGLQHTTSGVWATFEIVDYKRPWSPYDLQHLKVQLNHEYQLFYNPDRFDVDHVYLELNDDPNWTFYLNSDWARHPTDSAIQTKVNQLIDGASTDYQKAYQIWNLTVSEWNHSGGGPYSYFEKDTLILTAYNNDGDVYNRLCWGGSVIASSYTRATNLPSRIIYYTVVDAGGYPPIHYTAEVYINNDWVPIDVDNHYNWFGKNSATISAIRAHYPEDPVEETDAKIDKLYVLEYFSSSDEYCLYNLKDFDYNQWLWYNNTVWSSYIIN